MNLSLDRSASLRRPGAAFLASALFLAAGAAAQEAPRQPWIGESIGIAKPQMTLIGYTPLKHPTADVAEVELDADAGLRSEGAERIERTDRAENRKTISLIALNATTGETYRLEAPRADFERLHLEMVMRGEASARGEAEETKVDDSGLSMIAEESWSDGVANFVRRGISDGFPANHDVFRRIGQIGSGCSGSLVGPRHVLTAAHCVVDRVTQTAYSTSFRPRRDWSQGTTSATEPHGARPFVWYYFPDEYWDGTCNSTGSCNKYDIALGILSSNMSVPHMGYWYANVSTLDGWTKAMRGYPRCNTWDDAGNPVPDIEAPANCQRSTLYGDVAACSIGSWSSPDADGWNRELWVDCDGARGMSGSPMYTDDSPGGLVALGVYSQFLCYATNCASHSQGDFPNGITRITPEYAALISMGKSLWACASGTCS